jgi:hypothetical protein
VERVERADASLLGEIRSVSTHAIVERDSFETSPVSGELVARVRKGLALENTGQVPPDLDQGVEACYPERSVTTMVSPAAARSR